MTENENSEWTPSLRDWLRIADFQVAQSFAAAFGAEGLSRRDGMLLRRLAEGPLTTDRDKKLRSLEDRGWAHQRGDGTWEVTQDGREAADRLSARLDELHATIRDAVGEEQYAALASSLEGVSRALGWDESAGLPGRGWGRPGFGPGFRAPGFGPGAGFPPFGPWTGRGFGPGFAGGWDRGHRHGEPGRGPWEHHGQHGHPGHHGHGGYGAECGHGHHDHGHHEHEHGGSEAAYERGFAAGFAARREA